MSAPAIFRWRFRPAWPRWPSSSTPLSSVSRKKKRETFLWALSSLYWSMPGAGGLRRASFSASLRCSKTSGEDRPGPRRRCAVDRLACADLAEFPLQLLLKRHPEWSAYPAAVIAEDKPQAEILWMNEKARRAGVRPDLRFAAASSLAPDLRAGVVPLSEIRKEMAALTERLRRFTPDVEASHEEPGVFWLSGRGLSLLHPSPEEWAAALYRDIEAAGLPAGVVAGFTRFGTYAVAKTANGAVVFQDSSEERAAARAVELDCLNLDRDFRDTLLKLGIKNVGDRKS